MVQDINNQFFSGGICGPLFCQSFRICICGTEMLVFAIVLAFKLNFESEVCCWFPLHEKCVAVQLFQRTGNSLPKHEAWKFHQISNFLVSTTLRMFPTYRSWFEYEHLTCTSNKVSFTCHWTQNTIHVIIQWEGSTHLVCHTQEAALCFCLHSSGFDHVLHRNAGSCFLLENILLVNCTCVSKCVIFLIRCTKIIQRLPLAVSVIKKQTIDWNSTLQKTGPLPWTWTSHSWRWLLYVSSNLILTYLPFMFAGHKYTLVSLNV